MRIEIKSAANFLVDLARLSSSSDLNDEQLERFRGNVVDILLRHYTDHWFPDKPNRGSGYRCIRINGTLDPLIARAGFMMGLAMNFLRGLFPKELTMWVDPQEVAYRIGENGSICVLYEEAPVITPRTPSPEIKTPVKAPPTPAPVPQQATSPPPSRHHTHHHHHHNHFSPSKSVVSTSPLQQSPPLSPVTTQQQLQQQQAQQQAAMQLSMFLMGGKDAGSLVKCKESLRSGLEPRPLHMDRLFVSS